MRALVAVALVALAVPVAARTISVSRGQSIQAAVDRAGPGDTVAVDPGVYHEAGRPCPTNPANTCAVVVTKNDVRLFGRSSPTGNGAAPDPSLPSVFAVDLAWDTTGTNNCWRTNTAGTTFPPNLPSCD